MPTSRGPDRFPRGWGGTVPPWRSPLIEQYIRDVPDFPKPGILFKDITPLLQDPKGLEAAVSGLAATVDPSSYDIVCGIESRGFIFGTALAHHVGKGFIPIRKPGKLPWKTASESYELEYGTDTIEIHIDATEGANRVLMVDDLLATGGTMAAALKLVRRIGGTPVACSFVIELGFLPGREKLGDIPVHSLLTV
ncbi:MAG: adenine phosphoribosyltransferase [Planctomycetes bacterium]|nr:adenine phosphoribosyltransferase [Planctomycetota bacterium]MCB9903056.1 adenine phosphoribosyltransferase [Planctomycetota bacterium]